MLEHFIALGQGCYVLVVASVTDEDGDLDEQMAINLFGEGKLEVLYWGYNAGEGGDDTHHYERMAELGLIVLNNR